MFGSMESKEAFLSKLVETRSTILEKAKENISAAQEKQKKEAIMFCVHFEKM